MSADVMTRDECLRRLAQTHTGRLGFHANALPMLLPVDFALDGGAIVLRVRAGSQVDAATRDAVVAFQVDGVDAADGQYWSVSVTGVATHIEDPSELVRIRGLRIDDRIGHDEDRCVRVTLDVVAGCRTAD